MEIKSRRGNRAQQLKVFPSRRQWERAGRPIIGASETGRFCSWNKGYLAERKMVLAILKCEAYIEMPFPMQMQNGKINDVHFLQPGKFPIPCKPFNRKLTGELWLWNNRLFAMVWRLNRLLQAACNKIFALSWNIETYPPPTPPPPPSGHSSAPPLLRHPSKAITIFG